MVAAVSNTTTNTLAQGSNNLGSVAGMQERFLKLLVAQINNQDPLNPMDNAQMTSQMAQINTVSGIAQVNETLQNISGQFTSMQALQATALVGHDVLTPGTTLARDTATGLAGSAFDLGGTASAVKIEILSPTGTVLDTIQTGAMAPGRHSFSWDASATGNYTSLNYRITAVNGQQNVAVTPYSTERVLAVGVVNGAVSVDLQSGRSVPYANITAVL